MINRICDTAVLTVHDATGVNSEKTKRNSTYDEVVLQFLET